MRLKAWLVFTLFSTLFPAAVFAVNSLEVANFSHRQKGLDHILSFDVRNGEKRDAVVQGRFIVLNVYDTSPPVSIPLERLEIPAGEVVRASARWRNAPLLGQIRALLVLNGGPGMTSVEEFVFWTFPWPAFLALLGAILFSSGVALSVSRFLKKRKSVPRGPGPKRSKQMKSVKKEKKKPRKRPKRKKYPSGMTGYVVEYGDTVVTVANRFEVTWEDVVRSNRLKPPYPLKPGSEILIPIHALRRSEDGETHNGHV